MTCPYSPRRCRFLTLLYGIFCPVKRAAIAVHVSSPADEQEDFMGDMQIINMHALSLSFFLSLSLCSFWFLYFGGRISFQKQTTPETELSNFTNHHQHQLLATACSAPPSARLRGLHIYELLRESPGHSPTAPRSGDTMLPKARLTSILSVMCAGRGGRLKTWPKFNGTCKEGRPFPATCWPVLRWLVNPVTTIWPGQVFDDDL